MIVRGGLNCGMCKNKYEILNLDHGEVLSYFFDNRRKEIRFYPSIYLEDNFDGSVEFHSLKLKKIPNNKHENTFDFLISCPICQNFSMVYSDVPGDWEVFIGSELGLKSVNIDIKKLEG